MATTKKLVELFRAIAAEDFNGAAAVAAQVCNGEEKKGHRGAARLLRGALSGYRNGSPRNGHAYRQPEVEAAGVLSSALVRLEGTTRLNDVFLSKTVRQSLTLVRDDFWASTSNKQLNFLQHVRTILRDDGRAAVVLPDNVLFEGGAGESIRRKLLDECDLHTLLRLPTGIFYAQGVKANVLFFDKKPPSKKPSTNKIWIYDLRTNFHVTLKANPIQRSDLDEFVNCYKAANRSARMPTWSTERPNGRWRAFSIDEVLRNDKCSLDIFWLDDSANDALQNLPDPATLASEMIDHLQAALIQLEDVADDMESVKD